MNLHQDIQLSLYDYWRGDLSDEERARVASHLQNCPLCAGEYRQLIGHPAMHPPRSGAPHEQRSDAFWQLFPDAVLEKLPGHRHPRLLERLRGYIGESIIGPWRLTAIGAAVAACVLLALMLTGRQTPVIETPQPRSSDTDRQAMADERIRQFLRKSKILLVGVANSTPPGDEGFDLSFERRKSRELLAEGRSLREHQLDGMSARLIDDTERILLKLANSGTRNGMRDFEVVRDGIARENLLFRVRMAESAYDTSITHGLQFGGMP